MHLPIQSIRRCVRAAASSGSHESPATEIECRDRMQAADPTVLRTDPRNRRGPRATRSGTRNRLPRSGVIGQLWQPIDQGAHLILPALDTRARQSPARTRLLDAGTPAHEAPDLGIDLLEMLIHQ